MTDLLLEHKELSHLNKGIVDTIPSDVIAGPGAVNASEYMESAVSRQLEATRSYPVIECEGVLELDHKIVRGVQGVALLSPA